jgi:Ca2+-transporting ATPase
MDALRASTLAAEDVLAEHGVDGGFGMAERDVSSKQHLHGLNELDEEEDEPLWRKFIDQFKDPLIGLLLASAVGSCVVKQYDDAVSIMCAVVIVSTVAFVQEYRSEQSIAALASLIPPVCNCLRGGQIATIEAKELVPGDIVVLALGDRVPADCRVLAATDLLVDESSLTGESVYMEKSEELARPAAVAAVKAEVERRQATEVGGGSSSSSGSGDAFLDPEVEAEAKRCILFMSTTVQHGHARAVVVATGMRTDFGRTFQEMKDVEQRKTPLQVSMVSTRKLKKMRNS